MIKKCPYCEKPVDITDTLESGYYVCPYHDCSETFYFNKLNDTLHKIEGLVEEEGQHNISGLLAEFDKALEDEIKAVKTRGGDRTLALKDGKFVGEIVGEPVYQFNLERKIPVADETPAQIEIMGRNYRASIVRFLEFKLEVRITDFDGERIPFALLKIDATYVLRKLREALSFLGSRPQSAGLALKAFNYISPKCSRKQPDFTLGELDDYQSNAIETCLGNEVSFIHGPPGTGKTITLVNVVNDLANNGKKVLVSCHTNIACDNVIENFFRYDHEKTVKNLLNNGQIVRIGTPVLQDEKIKALTIEAIYARLSKDLLEEKKQLADLMNSLIEKNKEYYEYKQISLECETLEERIASCKENISASKDTIKQHILEEDKLNELIYEKKQLLSIAERRNAIINFFKGTRPKRLRLEIDNLNNRKTEKIGSRLQEEKRLTLLSNEMEKLNTSFSKKSKSLPEGIKIEQIESVLSETENTLEKTKAKIIDVDDRISKLNEGVLNNAKVIVSTLAKTFIDPILMNMQFDVVAIDEASIAPLPMLFYVYSLAMEKVVIFGDPKQLAPIKLANTPAAEKWLKKDIFQEADAVEESPDDPRVQSLNNQYRMHKEILEIVNRKFYEGNLHDRKKEYHEYDNLMPMPEHRVVVIDTSNANACMSSEKMGPKSWSRYNLYHTQILEKILHDLIDGNYIKQEEIGIITPYRSQASFIREILNDLKLESITLGTVHSFQGIEKKYIIFDLVEAPGGRKVGVLVNDKHKVYSGKPQSENNALRLLTVAFSRPREKLLIISHNRHMLSNLPENSVIRNIITDLINREAIIDGSSLVPYYVPVDEYPDVALFDQKEMLGKETVFNQRSFYPHLIQDLKNAEKEVIIISGYMSVNRIEKLTPHFIDLLSRGINIKIFTKPPREQMSREREIEELHHKLKNMRIEIYQDYGTHEKIVAIDGHILYAGSLNVLSFNHSSSEMMIRSDSKPKLQKVFSVLVKTHREWEDYLIKTGYVIPEQPVDLTPERFQNVLNSVRPKHRQIPKNKQEAKEYYRSIFVKLRWVMADDKRFPNFAVLFNETIEAMLNDPPATVEQLLSLPEFAKNKTNVRGYEKIILQILKEYRETISAGKQT
jgi:superfamily I DNA and/or RNA helicase